MKGVLLTIAGNDLACARAWGAECERRVRGENPSGFSEPDRYFKNFLGELAWLRWCRLYGLRCRYKVITDGKSVSGKFALYAGGEPQAVMVKTAGWAWYKEFMLPVKQGVDERALYVGLRVRCEADTDIDHVDAIDVECWGTLPGVDVAALPVGTGGIFKVPTRHCLLDDLGSLAPVRNSYERGDLELRGRAAVELEPTPPFRLT